MRQTLKKTIDMVSYRQSSCCGCVNVHLSPSDERVMGSILRHSTDELARYDLPFCTCSYLLIGDTEVAKTKAGMVAHPAMQIFGELTKVDIMDFLDLSDKLFCHFPFKSNISYGGSYGSLRRHWHIETMAAPVRV